MRFPTPRRFRARPPATVGGPFAELRKDFPPERLVLDPAELRVYECDAFPLHKAAPGAAVLCASRDDVQHAVLWASAHGIPFVPRAAGTCLSGGATPVPGGLVIDVNPMRRILSVDVENRLAVTEPGVWNVSLSEAVASAGLQYAPDPSSQRASTIGGNIAENAGGPHCLRHGVTVDHLLALEVVLPDGTIARLGGAAPDAEPLDLVGLFAGSEGTFGIVTEATVRLIPLAARVRTYLAAFDSMALATRTVAGIVRRGIVPLALEIIDRRAIGAIEASVFAAGYPRDAAAVLLIEIGGPGPGLEADEVAIRAIAKESRPIEFRAASDDAERELLWRGRKGVYGAMGRIDTDVHVLDGVVPRTRLEEALEVFYRVADTHGLKLSNAFHAGDGNVHPTISYDGRDPTQVEKVLRASREIAQACVDLGGTISGEHGIGLEKRSFLPMIFTPEEIDLQRAVRRAFDPRELANPGKIFPEAEKAAPLERATGAASDPIGVPRPLSTFESAFYGHEVSCVVPATDAELLAAADHGMRGGQPVVPAGAGSHAYLGNQPERAPLLVSLSGRRRILQYVPEDFTIRVEAGLPLGELRAALAEHDQELPLDLPPEAAGTVGGLVAAGLSGPRTGSAGPIRSYVLGTRAMHGGATQSGSPGFFRSGGMVVKNVAGYNLARLEVGALGTAGIIVEVSLRLRTRPQRRASLLVAFSSRCEAGEAVQRARGRRLEPAALWILDEALAEEIGLPPPAEGSGDEAPTHIAAWVFEGSSADVEHEAREARKLLVHARVLGTREGEDEEAEGVLQSLARVSWPGGAPPADLGIALIAALPSGAARVDEAARGVVGRLGSGVLSVATDALTGHVVLRFRGAGGLSESERLAVRQLSSERARGGRWLYLPPSVHAGEDRLLGSPREVALTRRVLGALDPRGVFAPERLPGNCREGSAPPRGA